MAGQAALLGINAAMLAVAAAMEKAGIAKDSVTAAAGKYKYRGIDAALNALARPMVEAGLTVAPSYKVISHLEHATKDGKGMLSVVEGTLAFYAADGSSRVVGPFIGEAFDSFDKSMSKASSVAYRNGMFLTFVIPLGPGYDPEEGEDDGEQGRSPEPQKAPPQDDSLPAGIHLSPAQKKWLNSKLELAKVSEAEVLKKFRRIDASNAPAVAAWLES